MHALSHLALLVATVFWASSFAVGKFGIAAMPASEIIAIRFLIGAAILWPILLVRTGGRIQWRTIGVPGLVVGALSPCFATLMFYWGMLSTSSINSVVIAAWMPLTTSLAAWLVIGERVAIPVVVGSFVALGGIVVLVSADAHSGVGSLFGDMLCVGGLLVMSLSQTYLRRLNRDNSDSLAITTWQLTGGALMGGAILFGFESWLDSRGIMAVPSTYMWILIVYLAIFVSIATFLLNNYGLRRIGAGHSSLYYVLMAPLGVPISALWLGEPVGARDLLAMALVVGGVAIPLVAGVVRSRSAAVARDRH